MMEPNVFTRPYAEMPDPHPLAEIFPIDDGKPLDDLVKDVARHGQQEPIVLLDGKILDGRRRWMACARAGINPKVREFDGPDPLAFVISANLRRRHLNTRERAMIAAEIAKLRVGRPSQIPSNEGISQTEAAKLMNVSVASVERAVKVQNSAIPEVVEAVKNDTVSVSDAASIADLPAMVQKAAVRAVASGKANTLRAAAPISRQPRKLGRAVDLKDFDRLIGKIIRFADDVHAAEAKQNVVQHAQFLKACDEVIAAWKSWQRN